MTPIEYAALSAAAFAGIGIVVIIAKRLEQRERQRRIMAEYLREIER